MTKAVYVVADIEIIDRKGYAVYEAGFMPILATHNGKLLAVDDTPIELEGDQSSLRRVIIRFDSATEARAWYESEAYQALMKHRLSASDGRVAIVEGIERPAR